MFDHARFSSWLFVLSCGNSTSLVGSHRRPASASLPGFPLSTFRFRFLLQASGGRKSPDANPRHSSNTQPSHEPPKVSQSVAFCRILSHPPQLPRRTRGSRPRTKTRPQVSQTIGPPTLQADIQPPRLLSADHLPQNRNPTHANLSLFTYCNRKQYARPVFSRRSRNFSKFQHTDA